MDSHRAPWECSFAKEDKSKCNPGVPPKSDREYFEIMSLCILQSGLGWGMVRRIWPRLKGGFLRFDVDRLADKNANELLKAPGVIKNKRKVEAIIKNAQKFKAIQRKYGSFQKFIDSLKSMRDEEAIQTLMKEFAHFGDYSAEYYLHSVGYWK